MRGWRSPVITNCAEALACQSIRTHVLIPNGLFEQAEKLARKMKVSRSRLFVIALEEYIQRRRNRELLEQINAAYADEPDAEEEAWRRKARSEHRRLVKGEWCTKASTGRLRLRF